MNTDINKIRITTKAVFNCVPIEPVAVLEGLRICQHPFTSSLDLFDPSNGKHLDLTNHDDYVCWRDTIFKSIDQSPLELIYYHIGSAWKMTWFKYVHEDMDEKDYARYLKSCWVTQENPNQDANVSLREAIKLFRSADKKFLMNEEEWKHYKELPPKVTIFRGVSPHSERYGLSWTDDIEKAVWFKERFERDSVEGCLLTATIDKKHILTYINVGEKELVVDVFKIKSLIRSV